MEQSQKVLVTLTAVLFCACLVASLPAARSSSSSSDGGEEANEDFRHLITLLGKLKNADSSRRSLSDSNWGLLREGEAKALEVQPAQAEKLAQALKQSLASLNKRNWSYDYGLGGGRFGKRYYGDYGIGGGRFGRDVDHVDIADTNDATL